MATSTPSERQAGRSFYKGRPVLFMFICMKRPGDDCVADLDNFGSVDIEDLLVLIGAWGTSDGDCDADGDTDIEDLLYLIGSWGNSCTP